MKNVVGKVTVKSMKEEINSISAGSKTELKIRMSGVIQDGEEVVADIESFVFKGDPVKVREIMSLLNLDTIDESTTLTVNKNTQTRLDEED